MSQWVFLEIFGHNDGESNVTHFGFIKYVAKLIKIEVFSDIENLDSDYIDWSKLHSVNVISIIEENLRKFELGMLFQIALKFLQETTSQSFYLRLKHAKQYLFMSLSRIMIDFRTHKKFNNNRKNRIIKLGCNPTQKSTQFVSQIWHLFHCLRLSVFNRLEDYLDAVSPNFPRQSDSYWFMEGK